ncbi:uncharacterized protein Dana_GF27764, isoform A [Drosophila ananassae]|uniref:Uncharacterized protein, isoform A n=1 Tax=Drosophila ananassae TaxID=7217 RepID=A0A0P9AAK5_DROAN|nr:uncharacterized protein Dana_GF27764, isoform A [Drosophila ananassae]
MPGTKTAYPARPMPGRCVYWRPTRNGDWLTTRGQALTTEPSGSSSSSSEDPAEEQALDTPWVSLIVKSEKRVRKDS